MNIVLLSGGSGKRLWPLSNDTYSKQFLKVLSSKDGGKESMIQRVFSQIKNAGLTDNILISTGSNQSEFILDQIGDTATIIAEPMRRDTFPAIALACSHLIYEQDIDEDEVIIVLPVDPYVDDDYFLKLKEVENLVLTDKYDLVLMGVTPTYPSEKYGYILSDDGENVKGFKEKPNVIEAKLLIEDGALWNLGIFAFRLKYMMNIVKKYVDYNSYAEVYANYEKLSKNSMDYEVAEKAKSVGLIKYIGTWKDLGTWNTLSEEMGTIHLGKVKVLENCTNTHVINELDIPIVSIGVKDVMIVASENGILIVDKEQSSFLKDYLKDIDDKI